MSKRQTPPKKITTSAASSAAAAMSTSSSSLLEKEAAEMEDRLKLLRSKMKSWDEEDASIPRKGGARWKSARDDRGTVTTYAKDVLENNNKNRPIILAEPKRPHETFKTKEVLDWKTKDVSDWMESIAMGQYKPVFLQNDINGPVLLEIALDDLDYMQITALGHRKTILKSIEELRRSNRVVVKSASSKTLVAHDKEVKEKKAKHEKAAVKAAVKAAGKVASEETKQGNIISPEKVHWSQLEPLISASEAPSIANKSKSFSLLDASGDDQDEEEEDDRGATGVVAAAGELDEEVEHAAFQAAVMEWRNSGGSSNNTSSDASKGQPSSAPRASTDRVLYVSSTAEKGPIRAQQIQKEDQKVEGAPDSGLWRNPFAPPSSSSSSRAAPAIAVASSQPLQSTADEQRGNILRVADHSRKMVAADRDHDGLLDEEREHAEFVRAVDSWRSGKSAVPPRERIQALVSHLEAGYSQQARDLQEKHDKAVADLAKMSRTNIVAELLGEQGAEEEMTSGDGGDSYLLLSKGNDSVQGTEKGSVGIDYKDDEPEQTSVESPYSGVRKEYADTHNDNNINKQSPRRWQQQPQPQPQERQEKQGRQVILEELKATADDACFDEDEEIASSQHYFVEFE